MISWSGPMKYVRVALLLFVLLIPACLSPYLLPSAYLAVAGLQTGGQVTAKHEQIRMYSDDRYWHTFQVQYRYRVPGAKADETGAHSVNPALFDMLRVGAPVKVVYAPLPFVRSLPIVGMGSALADSTWFSRLQGEGGARQTTFELAAVGLALLLAVLAFYKGYHALALPAAFAAAVVCVAILPFGFLVFPILFGVARRMPGKGYGWVLVASMVVSAYVLYWRVPKTPPLPPGPTREVLATVRQVKLVDEIWSTDESGGEHLRQPFQMADLEFTPEGARDSVHALDRVDTGSVPNLGTGGAVRVVYALSDPRSARAVTGTHTYVGRFLKYYLELTYGGAAVVMLVIWPLLRLSDRLFRRFTDVTKRVPAQALPYMAQLPPDDPRRQALEAYLRRARK